MRTTTRSGRHGGNGVDGSVGWCHEEGGSQTCNVLSNDE
jgi:hypothetical protein